MTETPEGFLICHNVPIARTGNQDYLRRELGLTEDPEGTVRVYRSPAEVFDPAAVASFEGKSVTDEHPSANVRPDNYSSVERGVVTHVRRGPGEDHGFLLADLVIKDPQLISAIQHGKREVSCGYDCDYVPMDGGAYQQANIRGNHVAVVAAGRAGPEVAIRDSLPQPLAGNERRRSVKATRKNLVGRILGAFAKDADPEELAEAVALLHESEEDPQGEARPRDRRDEDPKAPEKTPELPKTGDDGAEQQILAAVQALGAKIDALEQRIAAVEEDGEPEADALSQLEQELGKQPDANGEESVTIEPTRITGDSPDDDPGPVVPPAQRAQNPLETGFGTGDRASVRQMIRVMRPIIAALPEAQRKQATDALAKELRENLKGNGNGYAGIAGAVRANGARDTKPTQEDPADLGQKIMREHNLQARKKEGNK